MEKSIVLHHIQGWGSLSSRYDRRKKVSEVKQYLDLLDHVRTQGVEKADRTGTGTLSVFGYQMRFDLQKGFPVLTTKKLHLRSIVGELLWFLRGDTNVKWLQEHGITIWDEWADEDGNLGPVYGHQWRSWPTPDGRTIDQITKVIESIRTDPDGRRHIVSAWNVADVDSMALPPCHCLFQFYVRPASDGGKPYLDCQLYQRSADVFLGVPFNIASYALLLMIVAQLVDMRPGDFIWVGGDTHLYLNHLEQAELQLTREPKPLPQMVIKHNRGSIDHYEIDDFELIGYEADPSIKAPIAV